MANKPTNPTTAYSLEQKAQMEKEEQERAAAAQVLSTAVNKSVGAAMGEFERTLTELKIAVNAQGALIQTQSQEIELLMRQLTDTANAVVGLDQKINESPVNAGDRSVRLRMGHTISTKGIHQYEGTVEIEGGTQEEVMAARLKMDQDLAKLQPIYEEFVEPVVLGCSIPEGFEAIVDKMQDPPADR